MRIDAITRFCMQACAWLKAFSNLPFYLPLIIRGKSTPQALERRTETASVSEGVEQVANYNQVMTSKLAVFYALGLRVLYRIHDFSDAKVLDIAPGPGHFSLCLQKWLGTESLQGIDLSEPMVETANRNAAIAGVGDRVKFSVGDATKINGQKEHSFDLVVSTFATHHLPNEDVLANAIVEMERMVSDEGIVMIMDLARLPSADLTEDFVKLAGKDYKSQGLSFFYQDFYESMFAAWTTLEMRDIVTQVSRRHWVQLGMSGLPTLQILIGMSSARAGQPLFQRFGTPWNRKDPMLQPDLKPEWYLAEVLFALGDTKPFAGKRNV